MKNVVIRDIREAEYPILKDFTYLAIFVPAGVAPPKKSIVDEPQLQIYYADFGKRRGDVAVAAVCGETVVGVAWARIMNDYGHIRDDVPSLAIAVHPEMRRRKIGSGLLSALLNRLGLQGFKQASLSVQKQNYALKMYLEAGFRIYAEKDDELILTRAL